MQNIFTISSLSLLVIVIGWLLVVLIKNRSRTHWLTNALLQTTADKTMLLKQLEKLLAEEDSKTLEQSEGFLNFVSQSRDWAFEYIENVQEELAKFDNEIQPIIDWANTYGQVMGDNSHLQAILRISTAYDKLKEMLPKNTETPNN